MGNANDVEMQNNDAELDHQKNDLVASPSKKLETNNSKDDVENINISDVDSINPI